MVFFFIKRDAIVYGDILLIIVLSHIQGTAHRLCGVLLHYAEKDAQRGRKDRAREVLKGIIDKFGIDEEVERARRALTKVEEG